MLAIFLAGFAGAAIGFVGAMPAIGPVTLSVVRASLVHGRKAGFHVAAGAASVDSLLCLLALAATGAVGSLLHFLGAHPVLSFLLQLLCVSVLVGYGIVQLRRREPAPVSSAEVPTTLVRLQQRGHFLLGAGLALMNLAQPTFPSSLLYISIVAHEFQLVQARYFGSLLAFALGFGMGTFGWLALLAHGMQRFRYHLRGESLERLHRIVGVALIGIGTMLGIRILTAVRWHELLRFLPAF